MSFNFTFITYITYYTCNHLDYAEYKIHFETRIVLKKSIS